MKAFLSYYSAEESDAEDMANHLRSVFAKDGLELFLASSWDSIAPGDAWESKAIDEITQAKALLVLMSPDALTRPWINFEIGIAWTTQTRILFFCHKGLTPSGLPRPYGGLQAVDLNKLNHEEMLNQVVEAVSRALEVTIPMASEVTREVASASEPTGLTSFTSTHRAWSLRPSAHIGEKARGRFLVGTVFPALPDRDKAAGLQPGEALYVRLFLGLTPEGRYIAVMAGGDVADFFERVHRDTTIIDADIRLAASFQDQDQTLPLLVIDEYKKVSEATSPTTPPAPS